MEKSPTPHEDVSSSKIPLRRYTFYAYCSTALDVGLLALLVSDYFHDRLYKSPLSVSQGITYIILVSTEKVEYPPKNIKIKIIKVAGFLSILSLNFPLHKFYLKVG